MPSISPANRKSPNLLGPNREHCMEAPKYEGSDRRKRPRRMAVVPVKVRSTEPQARPIAACTLDISTDGARLNISGWAPAPGDIINVERGAEKALFRIDWVGDPGAGRRGQVRIRGVGHGNAGLQAQQE